MYDFYKRYIRHVVLSDIGILGQDILLNSKVLCVGAGGLGSAALVYLASCGIGFLGIIDFDKVDLSNLNRQFMYNIFDFTAKEHNETCCVVLLFGWIVRNER